MTKAQQDAAKFLQLILDECPTGASDHNWRDCPRCLAIAQLQDRDTYAERLLREAITALKGKR